VGHIKHTQVNSLRGLPPSQNRRRKERLRQSKDEAHPLCHRTVKMARRACTTKKNGFSNESHIGKKKGPYQNSANRMEPSQVLGSEGVLPKQARYKGSPRDSIVCGKKNYLREDGGGIYMETDSSDSNEPAPR